MVNLDKFFSGKYVYGDDFSIDEIENWYKEEEEAYANLKVEHKDMNYPYHELNKLNGFRYLKKKKYDKVLGMGSASGDEFIPIVEKTESIMILEPSEDLKQMVIKDLSHLKVEYKKPEVSGKIPFADESFDIITCFGVLHHVPNVSYVLSEMIRVLKNNGILLLREPIRSMGDWRYYRKGLTKNERGIPYKFFDNFFKRKNITVINKSFCESLFFFKILNRVFRLNPNSYLYVKIDYIVSKLLIWNIHYHPKNTLQKISPGSIFYVVKKNV